MRIALAVLFVLASVGQVTADDIFAADAAKPLGIVAFVEGPAWHPSGTVFFTDVENNRIMRRDGRGMHVARTPSGRANGLIFDAKGRLIACEGGGEGGYRRVTRTDVDGKTVTVLANRFDGKRFNSPNDLTIDKKGRIYFTDPRYGPREGMEQLDATGRPIEGVYRIDPDAPEETRVTRMLSGGPGKDDLQRPNGIAVSPDGKTLYVVDNQNGTPDGNRKIWKFDLDAEGNVDAKSQKLVHDFGRGRGGDGMEVDQDGRLYVAAGFNVANLPLETADVAAGVYVFTPEGKQVGFIPIKMDMVTNVCFGGEDGKMLFVTAGHTLWAVPVKTPGYRVWPDVKP